MNREKMGMSEGKEKETIWIEKKNIVERCDLGAMRVRKSRSEAKKYVKHWNAVCDHTGRHVPVGT